MTKDSNDGNLGLGRIFVSYSRRGNGPKWKALLLSALDVFERHHLVDVWEDGKIRIGDFWDDEIWTAMDQAELALVLLTPEALESEYILREEFPRLSEGQASQGLPVIPVVCEQCDWRSHTWLQSTQAPNASQPLSLLSHSSRETVFRQLATDIAEKLSAQAFSALSQNNQFESTQTYLDRFSIAESSGLHQQRLIGREQELALLDLALRQTNTSIVSLIAWGGVGKSMLVQHWLDRIQSRGWLGVRRAYAWSFFSQGTDEDRHASEDSFFSHALKWFGVDCKPTASPWDKGRLLAEAVTKAPTVLILDGIEPLQFPPGPMGGQLRAPGLQSLLKHLARKPNPNQVSQYSVDASLCLITSREPLTNLVDFEPQNGSTQGSVLRIHLTNLTEEAGAALLHYVGVNRAGSANIDPKDPELLTASLDVGGHALTLNLLGRFIARAHRGDIRRRDLVKFEQADRNEKGGTTFRMLAAFQEWFARSGDFGRRQLAILRLLGLFDRPADADCMAALRQPPVILGLTDPLFILQLDPDSGYATSCPLIDEDWNSAISFLVDFNLVTRANEWQAIDCHPLIREFFGSQVFNSQPNGFQSAHRRLYEHLSTSVHEKSPDTLEDLQPLYQAVTHGCHAAMHSHVWDYVVFSRIHRGKSYYSVEQLGAYGTELAALACFFDSPWTCISPSIDTYRRPLIYNNVAQWLRALGRLEEAVAPMNASLETRIEQKNWLGCAASAINLSELHLSLGNITDAIFYAAKAERYATQSTEVVPDAPSGNDTDAVARFLQIQGAIDLPSAIARAIHSRAEQANALHQGGRIEEAQNAFQEAERLQAQSHPQYPYLYSLAGFEYSDFLLRNAECAAWRKFCALTADEPISDLVQDCQLISDRASKTQQWAKQDNAGLRVIALDAITSVRAPVYAAILQPTEFNVAHPVFIGAFNRLINDLVATGDQLIVPPGYLIRALYRCMMGYYLGPNSAQEDLDEAWEIASRGPMRLQLADIYLHRARLFFRVNNYPWESPKADLAAAEELINKCGYHRRDEELSDARRIIFNDCGD